MDRRCQDKWWICALSHSQLALIGHWFCNRRMPTLNMMLCGALAPAQPLKWTNVRMMWPCAMLQSPQSVKRCRNNHDDLCFCANRCDDDIVRLRLQLSDIMMQSNACDCNCWLCALPQVNMIVNDAILCLWSNLWKIVKLTGLSMILASYYGINLLRFARTMSAWVPYIWGDCTHCYVLLVWKQDWDSR